MTKSARCFKIALVLALTTLSLSACGAASPSASPTPSQTSGVRGKAMFAGPFEAGSQPRPGVTVEVHQGDVHGTIVAKTVADPSGAFKVELPPGTYTLIEVSDGAPPKTVTVEPGRYVTVTLTIIAR